MSVENRIGGHLIVKCSCGAIIRQCRCFAPDKRVQIEKNGCELCKKKGGR